MLKQYKMLGVSLSSYLQKKIIMMSIMVIIITLHQS